MINILIFSDVENYINLYNLRTYELNDSGHAMFYKNTKKYIITQIIYHQKGGSILMGQSGSNNTIIDNIVWLSL